MNNTFEKETFRILAENQAVSNNTWKTGLNNNDLIIGPSGAGKTRGYVLPNIMQCTSQIHFLHINRIISDILSKKSCFFSHSYRMSACKRRFIIYNLCKKICDIFTRFPIKNLFLSWDNLS